MAGMEPNDADTSTERDAQAEARAALSRNLKTAREAAKLTQAQVAKAAAISTEFYARCERGHQLPAVETLWRMAGALQVGADQLLATVGPWTGSPGPLGPMPPKLAKLADDIQGLDVRRRDQLFYVLLQRNLH